MELGFDYPTTIARLQKEQGYTDRELADCIGCSHTQLVNYRSGGQIPNHITGEMLCAVWDDHYPRFDPASDKKTLPMTKVQADGGIRVASLRGRVHRA